MCSFTKKASASVDQTPYRGSAPGPRWAFPLHLNLIIDIFSLNVTAQVHLDDLIDELPVEKRHLSELIIICWI